MIREIDTKVLLLPVSVTGAGVTGSYVDVQGWINPGGREVKAVLIKDTGDTGGGTIQSAEDTSGTGLATVTTLTTGAVTAGGVFVAHGVIPAAHRYVRFLGSSGGTITIGAMLQGTKRVA